MRTLKQGSMFNDAYLMQESESPSITIQYITKLTIVIWAYQIYQIMQGNNLFFTDHIV